MPTTLLLPWYYTDREMAEYAAKYFAPNGIPPGTKIERAPKQEPQSEAEAIGWSPNWHI